MGTKKITLRIPENDYAIIEHKALESHLSLRQYRTEKSARYRQV